MELKVWVDGLQRVVCGLSERTTCQEVIYALAHATGKTGRFVLVEKWRTSERSLSPHDRPLELLSKWGEYSGDVQFVLRCLEDATVHTAPTLQKQPSSAIIQQSRPTKSNGGIVQSYSILNGSGIDIGRAKTPVEDSSQSQTIHNVNNGGGGGGTTSPTNFNKQKRGHSVNGQSSTVNGILKPYFVDTSNPLPESGTLVRPTSAIVPLSTIQQHQPRSHQVARVIQHPPSSAVRLSRALSPTPPPSQQYSNGMAAAATADTGRMLHQQRTNGGGSLTVLSQSAHESLNCETSITNTASLDSSGTCLESSYSSSTAQPKQLDLSQTSFCSSSMSSSATSTGCPPGQPRTNGHRPPPPSYEAFVHRRNNMIANRNRQASPAPIYNMVYNGTNRSRTPVVPMDKEQPAPMTRDQLIKMIEGQQAQLRSQCQTMRCYDTEISRYQDSDQHHTPVIDNLRRELQQLEVERVHVKQKVEELRRQDLDQQLGTLRRLISDTLVESAKITEQIRTIDAELALNEEKIRQVSKELENDKDNCIEEQMTPATVNACLHTSDGTSPNLDALLSEKRCSNSPMKPVEGQQPGVVEVPCPVQQHDPVTGVWV